MICWKVSMLCSAGNVTAKVDRVRRQPLRALHAAKACILWAGLFRRRRLSSMLEGLPEFACCRSGRLLAMGFQWIIDLRGETI